MFTNLRFSKPSKWGFAICLTAFVAALATVAVPGGLDMFDQPYQVSLARDPASSPLAPLSALLGNWFIRAFNPGALILPFRWLGLALSAAAAAAGIALCARTANVPSAPRLVAYFALAVWAILLSDWYEYGWDRYSDFSLTLFIVAMYRALNRPGLWPVALGAVLGACATGARTPDLAVWPVAVGAFVLFPGEKTPERLRKAAVFSLVFVVCLYIIVCITYGPKPALYIAALKANTLTVHGHIFSFSRYLHIAGWFVPEIALNAMLLVGVVLCSRMPRGFSRNLVRLFTAALALMVVGRLWFVLAPWANRQYLTCIWFTLALTVVCAPSTPRRRAAFLLFCLAASACAALGSNYEIKKFIAIPLIPLAYEWAPAVLKPQIRLWLIYMLGIFLIFGTFLGFDRLYHDRGWAHTTDTLQVEPFNGIRTTPERAEILREADGIFAALHSAGDSIVIIGTQPMHHGWNAIAHTRSTFQRHDWQFDPLANPQLAAALDYWTTQAVLPANIVIVTPRLAIENHNDTYFIEHTAMVDSILSTRYRPSEESTPRFTVWRPIQQ